MYDLSGMEPLDASACGAALSALGSDSSSMEETANKIVGHLYENLIDKQGGGKACALVRLYKTHPYGELEPGLQDFAKGIMGEDPESGAMKCLTLLATVGENADWNSRANSSGHKAIPLPSEKFVGQIPMIARLVSQLGLEVRQIINPDPSFIVDLEEKTYNVFHVPEAVGSPYIPAQDDFVIPYGVRSVLGFGGILPTGDLYVVILFAKVPISREVAELFKPLAVNVREAVTQSGEGAVFS